MRSTIKEMRSHVKKKRFKDDKNSFKKIKDQKLLVEEYYKIKYADSEFDSFVRKFQHQ